MQNYKKRISYLNKINNKVPIWYCEYDSKSNDIICFTTIDNKTSTRIEVSHDTAMKFNSGEKHLYQYFVNVDSNAVEIKQQFLKPKTTNFFEVIQQTDICDIIIQKDYKNNKWKFSCNNVDNNIDGSLHFSITQKDNPNLLYRSITISVNEITDNTVEVDFTEHDKNTKDYSVFTVKKFQSYTLEEKHASNT